MNIDNTTFDKDFCSLLKKYLSIVLGLFILVIDNTRFVVEHPWLRIKTHFIISLVTKLMYSDIILVRIFRIGATPIAFF